MTDFPNIRVMIEFVNAKINIGLQVVNRRPDGYHDLQTLFYPVGLLAGTPSDPDPFCDILEIVPGEGRYEVPFSFSLSGRAVDCAVEKNLVWRAADIYFTRVSQTPDFSVDIRLEKHLPDGAGMGGGSADAAFTLSMLRTLDARHRGVSPEEVASDFLMRDLALKLGADCPFFLYNRPAYAEGVGERLIPVGLDLSDFWLLVVKPAASISTKEAFAGIAPRPSSFDLRTLPELPVFAWKECVHNDFEDSIFPSHPEFAAVKQRLYDTGAVYASLTGSGSCLYGLFSSKLSATEARALFPVSPTIAATYLLKL